MREMKVPTGNICIIDGEKGKPLEFLSIGDYGKEKNIKADFLGLTKEINGVPHGDLLPLSEKWVVTISSQYGCSMNCSFCDVPKVGKGVNATFWDMIEQVLQAIKLHPEITHTKRLNLHYARMGEPTWNKEVINTAYFLSGMFHHEGWGFHPVVSTMMPYHNKELQSFLSAWIRYKNAMNGNAGLQISINTTNEKRRNMTMPFASSLRDISSRLRGFKIKGRKITLNFALTDAAVDAELLARLFDTEQFLCKITPMHKTLACVKTGLLTDDGYDHYYPYKQVEENLKKQGFDVIVFIPSKEEDDSRITCGNAILATEATQ